MAKWKDIIGYEGIYQINENGDVKSLQRSVKNLGSYSGFINIKERVLKQYINKYGYCNVFLQKDGIREQKLVHRLVAITFIENLNNYKEINHKDFNKKNNNVSNLEWCTRIENITHYFENKNKSSKYKGVSYSKDRNKWCAYVDINKKRITLGRFDTENQANEKRMEFIKQLKLKQNEQIN